MTGQRVVLDTNVLLSALLFHKGSLTWLRHAWHTKHITPLVGSETAAELIRVLSYPKFRLTNEEREHLLGDYLPWCKSVDVPKAIDLPHCRDVEDRRFLALAHAAGADALVTGDKDLLALATIFEIPILTPVEFRQRLDG